MLRTPAAPLLSLSAALVLVGEGEVAVVAALVDVALVAVAFDEPLVDVLLLVKVALAAL